MELNGKSLDILEENIKSLKQLFPEVECDGKVDYAPSDTGRIC